MLDTNTQLAPILSASQNVDLSQDTAIPGPPPAYSLKPAHFVPISPQACSTGNRYVRLCPHQTLSFDRFREIATLPNIQSAERLDALIKLPTAHHDKIGRENRQCHTVLYNTPGVLPPSSHMWLCYRQDSRSHDLRSGFVLQGHWQMTFPITTKNAIRKTLIDSKVWVCPHTRLSDSWFVDAIRGLCQPGDRYDDPVEQYRAKQTGSDSRKICKVCDSAFEVHEQKEKIGIQHMRYNVVFSRYLGTVQSPDEPFWLQQCALYEVEEQSVPMDEIEDDSWWDVPGPNENALRGKEHQNKGIKRMVEHFREKHVKCLVQ